MTTKTIAASVYDWVDERLGITELAAFARHKTVPVHAQSFWYYWGGISLFLFLVQCFTGVLLLVYYRPGAEAFESVRQITFVMNFGWLIRSAHSWAANLMMFSVLVHMFSVYFMKAYRKPREFGWLSGMALLGLASVFGFSGYLLPMDELSYFATKVGHAARRTGRDGIYRAALLRSARCGVAGAVCSAAGLSPVPGAEARQRCAAVGGADSARTSQERALYAHFPAQGSGHVDHLAECAGADGLGVSVGTGQAVRRAGAGADRHSSRVVLHEPV
jgi:hypothetical protein